MLRLSVQVRPGAPAIIIAAHYNRLFRSSKITSMVIGNQSLVVKGEVNLKTLLGKIMAKWKIKDCSKTKKWLIYGYAGWDNWDNSDDDNFHYQWELPSFITKADIEAIIQDRFKNERTLSFCVKEVNGVEMDVDCN